MADVPQERGEVGPCDQASNPQVHMSCVLCDMYAFILSVRQPTSLLQV